MADRDQLLRMDSQLATACEHLSELLASLEVEKRVSVDVLREAMQGFALAALGAVWDARWMIRGDEELDPSDPQAMNTSGWNKEPDGG